MNFSNAAPIKILRLVIQKHYREYLRLLFKYGKVKRRDARDIRFLNYRIHVPDCLSFIFQFKDIFVRQSYRFTSISDLPVILDCGANIGISCLYFKSLYPKARIKAFEADPHIAQILRTNLQLNSITDIEIVSKAVWINEKGISFLPDGADGGSIHDGAGTTIVPSVRLKDYLENKEPIDFLKIDIEGAEVTVLEDCGDALRNVCHLFVEYHSWSYDDQKLERLLTVIGKAGFRYYLAPVTILEQPLNDREIMRSTNIQINVYATRV
jgi:FkbM family methyltransferase